MDQSVLGKDDSGPRYVQSRWFFFTFAVGSLCGRVSLIAKRIYLPDGYQFSQSDLFWKKPKLRLHFFGGSFLSWVIVLLMVLDPMVCNLPVQGRGVVGIGRLDRRFSQMCFCSCPN